jgi:Spy/CpxP family protein refolding chaperone
LSMAATTLPEPDRAPAAPQLRLQHRVILALDLGQTTGWAVRARDGVITHGTVQFRPGVDEIVEDAERRGEKLRGAGRVASSLIDQSSSAVHVARLPAIQKTFKFSDQQIQEVAEVHEQLQAALVKLFQGGDPDYRQVEKLYHKAWSQLLQTLDEQQQHGLQTASILFNGTFALADPAVAAKLRLSEPQQEQVAEIRQAHRRTVDIARRDMRDQGLSWEEMRPRIAELDAEAEQKLLVVLTPEQQTVFSNLREAVRRTVKSDRRTGREE